MERSCMALLTPTVMVMRVGFPSVVSDGVI